MNCNLMKIRTKKQTDNPYKQNYLSGPKILTIVLLIALGVSLNQIPWTEDLVHPGGVESLQLFVGSLLDLDYSPSFLYIAFKASLQTLIFALCGLSLALLIGIPLGIISSGNIGLPKKTGKIIVFLTRILLAFLRSIHELVWAWFFIAAIGLSPIAAIWALGINYAGILGRIFSDLLSDVPEEPLLSLRSTGASEWQVFLYGRFPMALSDMTSYIFYRFECAIRSSAILSFVGISGLGMQIELALDDVNFGQVWILLIFLCILILVVDQWSNLIRKNLS